MLDRNKAQIQLFIDSMTVEERKYFDIDAERIINTSVFSQCILENNTTIAIGGIAKWYRVFKYPWYVVKQAKWGSGIGSKLAKDNIIWAKRHNIHMFITAVERANTASVKILNAQGYKKLASSDTQDYVYVPFDSIGDILGIYIVPILIRIYLSPVGNAIKRARSSRIMNKVMEGY